jgi:DNA polymerase III subunit epsilon
MQREIVLDTETTGVDPTSGHRVIEIGCIELLGGMKSGKFFHTYLNPERDIPDEAYRIHGLSLEFLIDKPLFAEKVEDFLEFITDSPLIIHNAAFDLRFLNAELDRLGFPSLDHGRAVDTVLMARKKFPGSPANLDALCKRFNIDASARTRHGALLDAELLAEVYFELLGGRQSMLALDPLANASGPIIIGSEVAKEILAPREFVPSPEELEAHGAMLSKLKKPVWAE